MHHYASKPQGFGRHGILAMNALEEVLLWCDAANESHRTLMDEPTRIVLDTISSHYAEPLTLAFLARRSGQSVARLTRQFRKHAGASVQAVIEHRRLDRARQLLIHTTPERKGNREPDRLREPLLFFRPVQIRVRPQPAPLPEQAVRGFVSEVEISDQWVISILLTSKLIRHLILKL